MATYISLLNYTDQGIRNVKDTTKRAVKVSEMAKQFGVSVRFYWTLGSYDLVAIFEAPDDAAMATVGLNVGMAGNVRTQTLRAFTPDEMDGILSRLN